MTTPPSRGRRKKWRAEEDVGDDTDVGALKGEEVEQGRVVHGGRGRRHGDAKGIGGNPKTPKPHHLQKNYNKNKMEADAVSISETSTKQSSAGKNTDKADLAMTKKKLKVLKQALKD